MQQYRPFYRSSWIAYAFVIPQLIITGLFFIYPAVQSLTGSLYSSNFWGTISHFAWFDNYKLMLSDSNYINSFLTTLIFASSVSIITLSVGLLFAVLVVRVSRGNKIYKTLLLWPYAIASVITGVLWGFLFNPGLGVLTWLFNLVGVNLNYTVNGTHALIIVILGASWQQISYNFIFFLAGLMAIPKSLLEAASIDGATIFQRFWHITFPLISPTMFFLITINMIYSFFDTFGIIATLTHGGPANATNTLVYNVYKTGFIGQQTGYSAAQSVILMIIVISLSVIQFKYVERRVHYS